MSYLTYQEQIQSHIEHLRSKGFDISELKITGAFERCLAIGQTTARPKLVYKTTLSKLNNGTFGLATWYRDINGDKDSYQTYGLESMQNESNLFPAYLNASVNQGQANSVHEAQAKKAYGFWTSSSLTGKADYLDKKEVGYYGVRFKSTEKYGNAAIVPMRDEFGKIWNYQIINVDGSKIFHKGARVSGLFHALKDLSDSKLIGIAESYITAATCQEITNIPMVCAFSSNNLKEVALILSKLHPGCRIIIFADNDRHLPENVGLLKASDASNLLEGKAIVIAPEFDINIPAAKDSTDWNDFVRLNGEHRAREQIRSKYSKNISAIS